MSQAERQCDEKVKKKINLCTSCSTIFHVIYYWGKLLGINPLTLSKKNKLGYSYFSILYGCLLVIMYSFIYYLVIVERLKVLLPGESPIAVIADLLGITSQFLETSSTWFVFALYQNRIMIIVKCFVTAEKTSVKLGITDDWDNQFKQFGVNVILTNIFFLLSIVMSNIIWTFFKNFHLCVWGSFNIPAIASFNAGLVFISCLILVRRKFRRLNETVEFLGETRHDANVLLDRINTITQLHRELRNIIFYLEQHFSLYLLFCIVYCFFYQTVNCYSMYRYMKGHPREAKDLVYLGACSHWFFYSMVWLFTISRVCGSTIDEANSTGSTLHKLLNRCKNFDDFRKAANLQKMDLVTLDLLKNQISISAFGLIKLDHFMVYRVSAKFYWSSAQENSNILYAILCFQTLAMSANYLTVMLQLYD